MKKSKRLLLFMLITVLSILLLACGGESNEKANDDSMQDEVENKENTEFEMGDTWTVDDQWTLTIDSVVTTDYRNEYSEKEPEQVIIVTYTYENLGFEDDIQDLFFIPDRIQDANNELGYGYPANINTNPQPTPIGAKCVGAEEAFGLDNESESVIIYFEQYDSKGNMHKATFRCPVE